MLDPVVIDFAARGVVEALKAFDTIDKRIQQTERLAGAAAVKSQRDRVRAAQGEARERIRSDEKVAREKAKLEREAQQRVRRSSEMAGRFAAKQANEEIRAAQKATKEIERLEEQKVRLKLRAAEQSARISAKAAATELREHERMMSRFKRAGASGFKQGAGLVKGAFGMAAGGASLFAGFEIANVARKEMDEQRQAAVFVNAVTSGKTAPTNVAGAMGIARQVAMSTGMDAGEVMSGMTAYAQNARGGDFAGVQKNIGFFAKLAQTTGTNLNDIATAAGTLQSQNQGASNDEIKGLLLNAYAQSKQGSMSLVDAAKQIGTLGSTRSSFAGDVTKTQGTLIGLGQIARVGGDAGEAGTFVKDLALEASMANKKWRKTHGKDLVGTDKFGRIASPEAMIEQVFRGTGGNIQQINDLFGKRGGALFRELENSYIAGAGPGGKNVNGGIAAVMANVKGVTGATMSEADLDRQHAQLMDTPAQKFAVAVTKIEETVKAKLEPRLERFADRLPAMIPKIEAVIDAAGDFAAWFADNPIKGVGAVVLAAVSKDIAGAAIGEGVKSILMRMLAGGGGGGLPSGVGTAAAGLAIAGAAVGTAYAGMAAIDSHNASARAAAGGAVMAGAQGSADAFAMTRAARDGAVTPAQLAQMQARASAQAKVVEEKRQQMAAGPGVVARTLGVGADVAADQAAQFKASQQTLADMNKAIAAATASLRGLAAAGRDTTRNGPLPDRGDPRHP
jgi:hypothetical protein